MNPIQTALTSALPPKRKQTPSGWISFDAPCCVHNGEGADKRKRGGMMFNGDGTISYHCFNCGYTASYTPGRTLSYKLRKLMAWLGVPDSEVTRLGLEALKIKDEAVIDGAHTEMEMPSFETRELPVGVRPFNEWHDWKALEPTGLDPDLLGAIEYVLSRGLMIDDYDFMWTPEGSYKTRLIIPFYHNGDIVGYTARKIGDGSPKYITDSQPGYVFNLDRQKWDRKYCFVVEGPLDAVSIDGVAILSNDVKDAQATLINALRRHVVVVPDRDKAGLELAENALEYNWSVAFPEWDAKDVNEAVQKYGKVYTLRKIVDSIETNPVKIKIKAKTYFGE